MEGEVTAYLSKLVYQPSATFFTINIFIASKMHVFMLDLQEQKDF